MTSESFVAMIGNDIKPTSNNLTMRQQISARGFSRVSRKFADEVIELINKKKLTSTSKSSTNSDTNIMEPYPNKEAAIKACKDYLKAIEEVQNRFEVYMETEDSCDPLYVVAEYRDENGKRRKHFEDPY